MDPGEVQFGIQRKDFGGECRVEEAWVLVLKTHKLPPFRWRPGVTSPLIVLKPPHQGPLCSETFTGFLQWPGPSPPPHLGFRAPCPPVDPSHAPGKALCAGAQIQPQTSERGCPPHVHPQRCLVFKPPISFLTNILLNCFKNRFHFRCLCF